MTRASIQFGGRASLRSHPATEHTKPASRVAQTLAAFDGHLRGKAGNGVLTAHPSSDATTSSPCRLFGHVARLSDECPDTSGFTRRDDGTEGDQRTDGLRGAAVEFSGVVGLHGRNGATLRAGRLSNHQRQSANFMRGIPYVVC